MNFWLLEKSFFDLYSSTIGHALRKDLSLFAGDVIAKMAIDNSLNDPNKKFYTVENGSAIIPISGVLRNSASFLDMLFGFSGSLTYPAIQKAVDQANSDPTVKDLKFIFDSPGGNVSGLDNTAVAISMSKKPTMAVINSMCCSAALYLASQTDEIVATSEGSMIGSIGVMVSMSIDPNEKNITSSNAPKKAPDPNTEAGLSMIIENLDQMEALFIQRIAEGRKVSTDTVKSDFGQGGVLLAKKAVAVGLIDRLETAKIKMQYPRPTSLENASTDPIELDNKVAMATKTTKENSPSAGQNLKEKKRMDFQTLKTDHPDVFAQVFKLGEESGVKSESDRVAAFNAYITADPENEKLVALCNQYVAEGKRVDDVRPSLDVALRNGAFSKNANPGAVSTSTTDPVADAAALAAAGAEKADAGKYDAKKRREEMKANGAFRI